MDIEEKVEDLVAEAAEDAAAEAAEAAEAIEEAAEEIAEESAEAPAEEKKPAEEAPAKKPVRQIKKRRKVCIFCEDKIDYVDYKDVGRLRKCITERAKILPRRVTGTCAMHQRQLTVTIKRARHMALLPYLDD
jgi:small subunit ribosomal protein S18